MTVAFIFPGQGSQKIGMGKELYDTFSEAKEVFQEVDDVLNQNLSQLIFDGDIEDLTLTENTQPALMAVSVAVIRILEKQGGKNLPDMAGYIAGHSLGEYSALAAAESFTLADTARLLRIRGQAMQAAVPAGKGGMAALIGVDLDVAETIANAASADGEMLQIANDNSPGQVVLSGSNGAIERAGEIAAEHGAKRFLPLPVSAPFHSEMMQPAADEMQQALAKIDAQSPSVPLIANVTADITINPNDIKDLLVKQVTGRVRWRESVLFLASQGVTKTVEIGAGKVLTGLTKRISKELETATINTPADIEDFLNNI